MAVEYVPRFMPGQKITYTAGADLEGGQLVEIAADRTIVPAAAGSPKVVGVVGHTTKKGGEVVVYHLSGHVHLVKAASAIQAGDAVRSGANGTVAAGTSAMCGIALRSAAEGDLCEFLGQPVVGASAQ